MLTSKWNVVENGFTENNLTLSVERESLIAKSSFTNGLLAANDEGALGASPSNPDYDVTFRWYIGESFDKAAYGKYGSYTEKTPVSGNLFSHTFYNVPEGDVNVEIIATVSGTVTKLSGNSGSNRVQTVYTVSNHSDKDSLKFFEDGSEIRLVLKNYDTQHKKVVKFGTLAGVDTAEGYTGEIILETAKDASNPSTSEAIVFTVNGEANVNIPIVSYENYKYTITSNLNNYGIKVGGNNLVSTRSYLDDCDITVSKSSGSPKIDNSAYYQLSVEIDNTTTTYIAKANNSGNKVEFTDVNISGDATLTGIERVYKVTVGDNVKSINFSKTALREPKSGDNAYYVAAGTKFTTVKGDSGKDYTDLKNQEITKDGTVSINLKSDWQYHAEFK